MTNNRYKGLRPGLSKILYCSVIEKKIMYGHEVWGERIRINYFEKISSCQPVGLFTVILAYKNI